MVPNHHTCEEPLPNPHIWKIGIKTHTCEELVPNSTHLKNRYQIVTDVKNWYLIVTDVSDKIVKNWNRMQNAAELGDILSV